MKDEGRMSNSVFVGRRSSFVVGRRLPVIQGLQAPSHALPGPARAPGLRIADRSWAVLGDDKCLGQLADILLDLRQALYQGRSIFIGSLPAAATQAAFDGPAHGRTVEV